MARPQHQLRSIEYRMISSPPPPPPPPPPPLPPAQPQPAVPTNLPHQHQSQHTGFYQHSSPPAHHIHPTALIPPPPTSPLPSQFNGTIQPIVPPPGTIPSYPVHPAVVQQLHQPSLQATAAAAQQPAGTSQFSQVQLPPPNFGLINAGGSHSALSPPSFSWITHTQSPPLHPFPPPSTPLTQIPPIQSTPPRLSHSPLIPPPTYANYHDLAYVPQQQQQHIQPPAVLPANPQLQPPTFHPVHPLHHNVPDLSSHISGIQQAVVPRLSNPLPMLSLPYHQHLCPPEHMPSAVPPHHHEAQLRAASPPLQIIPAREPWMQSPPPPPPPPAPHAPQPQQIFQLTSPIPKAMVPQPHSQSGIQPRPPPPQVHIQLLSRATSQAVAASDDTSPRIRGKPVTNGHTVSTPTTSQVSEQMTSTTLTVQLLQPPLQPATVSTVVRPTPIYTTQAPPGFQSMNGESAFPGVIPAGPSGPSHLNRHVSAEQQRLVAQREWITTRSQALPRNGQASSLFMTLSQGSRPDTVLEQTQPLAIPMSSQEAKEVDEYNEFATIFRNHRLKLGYTHADVIQQVGIRYGYFSSVDTIAKFELIQLPLKIVRELKPVLQMWLKDTVKAAGTSEEEMKEIIVHASTSINPKRERKRRTNVDSVIKSQLEEEFRRKRTPSQSEMQAMANRMGMEKEFIRVWFCNRRQRQKKLEKELKAHTDKQTSSCSPKATIPSPSHDITVEVPSIIPCDMGSPIHECKIIKMS